MKYFKYTVVISVLLVIAGLVVFNKDTLICSVTDSKKCRCLEEFDKLNDIEIPSLSIPVGCAEELGHSFPPFS